MAFSKLLFLAWVYWFLSLLCFGVHSGGSEVSVNFLEAPPAVTNITSATFVFEVSINGNDGTCGSCYSCVICKLDNQISEDCADKNVSFTSLPDGKHKFEVCAAANQSQEAGCNSYHWTIGKEIIFHSLLKGLPNSNFFDVCGTLVEQDGIEDTVQPTAYLTASTLFTNAQNISVNISFSKPCIRDGGDGGFKCSAPDACNLLVHGAGHVLPSTLRILQPNLQFSLMIELSSSVQYGEVQLLMDENFCKDIAGNEFTRTSNSSLSIQIDRRDVAANLTTPLPTKIIQINVQSRTVLATNKYDDLKVWLYFSEPVLNTSEQILHALSTSEGQLLLTNEDTLGNQRFIYQIQILSPISIVTVTMNPNSIISRQGTAVLATEPMTIFYDIQRPAVSLSSSILRTRDSRIPIRIEFNKNVFGFNSSRVSVEGGHVIPDRQVNRADEDLVFVSINENVTSDIAGNENLVSNRLLVGHYNSVPEESIVASTFTTSTFGLTTLASGLLTLTIATLQANPALSPQSAPLMPDPSQNLFRILGHIQVFALSRWIAVDLPIGYYEFVRGLGWSIPYLRLPWEKNGHVSTPPATSINDTQNLKTVLKEDIRDSFAPVFSSPLAPIFLSSSSRLKAATPAQIKRELGDKNKTKNFCGGPQKSCGWKVFEKLMFWTGVLDLSILLVVRVFIFYMLRFKKSRSGCRTNFGSLAFPRIEILLTVHALSEVSMASAFLIHGRSTSGVIVAVLIWGIVSFILLASFLFLFIGITCGKLIKYEETPQREDMGTSPWLQCFTRAIVGPAKQGKWTSKNQFEVKFGPLFEDLRGPSKLSIETQNDSFSFVRKFLAGPGIYYTILQLVSKVTQGILNGVFPDDPSTKAPAIILLSLSSLQLFFLVLTKPFIFRRLQFVETVAVTTEVVMFASTVFSKQEPYDHGKKAVGITLLVLFLVSYLVQTINLWHGMYEQIKRLDNRRGSFVLGFRIDGNSTESQTAAGTEDPEAEQSGALVKKSSSKEGTTSASASLPSSLDNKPRPTWLNKKLPPPSRPRQFLRGLAPGVLGQISNLVTEEEKFEEGNATDPVTEEEKKEKTSGIDQATEEEPKEENQRADRVTEEEKEGNNGLEQVSEEEPKVNAVPVESQNAAGTEDPEAKQSGALVRKSTSKPSSSDNKPRPTGLNMKLPTPSRPRQFIRGLAPGVLGQIGNLVTEEEKFKEGNATDPVTEEEKKEKTSGIDQATEEEPKDENQSADRVTDEEREWNNGIEQVSEEEPKMNAVPIESRNAAGTEDLEAKQSGALVRKISSKEGTASASASLPSSSDNKPRPTGLNKKLPPPSRPRQFLRGLGPGVLSQISNLVTEEQKFEGNATDPVTEEEKKEKTSGIDQATEEEPKEENQSADRVTQEEQGGNNGIEQVREEEPKMNAFPIESQNASGTEDPEAKQSGALVRKSTSKEGTASAGASLPSSSDNKPRPTGSNKKLPPPSRPRQFQRGLCPGVLSHTSNQVTEEEKGEEGHATDQVTEEEKKEKTSGIDQVTEEEPKEENQSANRVTEEEKEGNSGIEQVSEEEPKMESHEITDEEKREKTSGIDKVCEEEPQGGHRADGVTREESSCVELVAEKEKREETHTTDQVDEENKIKSYCGFCKRVKQLLSELGAIYKTIELDLQGDGNEIQSALEEKTGKKTVPKSDDTFPDSIGVKKRKSSGKRRAGKRNLSVSLPSLPRSKEKSKEEEF
ncbi:Glutaredoxin [Dillenia turbinata]|uniref:Glutaredoxin n=1 Tax=Dillenia turbinata TaxID=194707 RepID=A0AAN8YZB4_9MAGN